MIKKNLEKELLDFLIKLKSNSSLFAVKVDFEAEGVRLEELFWLSRIVFKSGLKLAVKIGGCEAITNLADGKIVGADIVIAPMVESAFALKKFSLAVKRVYGVYAENLEIAINAETIACKDNFSDILDSGNGFLNVVNVGRVDLANSFGVGRGFIDGTKVLEFTRFFLEKAKEKGLIAGFGGGLSSRSIRFIKSLSGLADRFETRKLIFNFEEDEEQLRYCLTKAAEFEILCLQNKMEIYRSLSFEDGERLKMLQARLK